MKTDKLDQLDIDQLPKTRKEAASQGKFHYFTGKPCKHGHISPRMTQTCVCIECLKYEKERKHNYYLRNREAILKKNREYQKKHKERLAALEKDRYQRDRESILEKAKERYLKNKAARLEYQKQYKKNNPDKIRAQRKRYYERRKQRLKELNPTQDASEK